MTCQPVYYQATPWVGASAPPKAGKRLCWRDRLGYCALGLNHGQNNSGQTTRHACLKTQIFSSQTKLSTTAARKNTAREPTDPPALRCTASHQAKYAVSFRRSELSLLVSVEPQTSPSRKLHSAAFIPPRIKGSPLQLHRAGAAGTNGRGYRVHEANLPRHTQSSARHLPGRRHDVRVAEGLVERWDPFLGVVGDEQPEKLLAVCACVRYTRDACMHLWLSRFKVYGV